MAEGFTIRGRLDAPGETGQEALVVRAYDRDLPSRERRGGAARQLLGEALTDREGFFVIETDSSRYEAGEGIDTVVSLRRGFQRNPDVSFRVFSRAGQELTVRSLYSEEQGEAGPGGIVFNASSPLDVTLTVELAAGAGDAAPRDESEYGALLARIAPVVGDIEPGALLADDIDFLVQELAWDDARAAHGHLEMLRIADWLAGLSPVPAVAFYGWGRMGRLDRWLDTPFDNVAARAEALAGILDDLASMEVAALADALRQAIDERVISESLHERVDALAQSVRRRGRTVFAVRLVIVDAANGEPLAGYTVRVMDQGDESRELGVDVTDSDGTIEVESDAPVGQQRGLRTFGLRITGPRLSDALELTVDIETPPARSDASSPAVVPIAVAPERPTLGKMVADGMLQIPQQMLARLTGAGIRSLADIRRRGGLAGITGVADIYAELSRGLEARAELDRLTPDRLAVATLMNRNYTSVQAIAEAPLETFLAGVAAIGDGSGIEVSAAVALHRAARAQTATLDSFIDGVAAELANGFTPLAGAGVPLPLPATLMGADGSASGDSAALSAAVTDVLAPQCGCADCEAAVSPGAYLATLLDYAVRRVDSGAGPMTAASFAQRFHQPLADLPVDCGAVEHTLPQVRIAIEVLRGYLGARPLPGAGREAGLLAGEAAYRLRAYVALLAGAGASYDEIRRARVAPAQHRADLAARLGITLTPPAAGQPRHDELDQLFLDPELPAGEPAALTERALERIFGLAGTTRDPLSAGIKTGDAAGQVGRWRFDGIEPGRNTDADGVIHLSIRQDAAVHIVSVYRDVARTSLVAEGRSPMPSGPVRLVPREGSGLSGTVALTYLTDAADTSIAVAPLLLAWRLNALRSRWFTEDWPDGASASGPDMPAPLIDPHVIGLRDLRSARPGAPAYGIWLARTKELADRRTALTGMRDGIADPLAAIEAVVAAGLALPDIAVLDGLDAAQRAGERIESRLQPLGLIPAGFTFLMSVVKLGRAGQPILDAEWDVVFDLLVVARRRQDFAAWRDEERAAGMVLSPDYFRVAGLDAAPEQAGRLDLPLWLSTSAARRNWAEVLEACVAQEAAVVAGVDAARNAAEELVLPVLRDALIAASDAEGESPAERAEWLTRHLLIDMRMAGTQRTTRVAQGIETLQELLFRLRSGQFGADPMRNSATPIALRAVATPDGRTRLLARGDDDTLWEMVWDGQWRTWRSRGALPGAGINTTSEELAAAARGEGFDVAVIGQDRGLWVRRYDTAWRDWVRVSDDPPLTGAPALIARDAERLDAFVLRGADLRVLRYTRDGGGWAVGEDTETTSQRSPGAAALGPEEFSLIVARDAPALFVPQHRRWDGATWQIQDLDERLAGTPILVAVGPGRLDLFQNRVGALWHTSWDGTWQAWENVDAGLPPGNLDLVGTPAVCSPAPGIVDVFARRSGRGGDGIWHRRLDATGWSDWERVPVERFSLNAIDFDAEWEWLGSYATWRSAVFVRLYPDNLLQPSLAPRQTPAFRQLVAGSRPTRHLTPAQASELAAQYSAYLGDVFSLDVEASCQVATPLGPVARSLRYLFGRSRTGRVYWSSFDPQELDTGFAQTFWEEVPLAAEGSDSQYRVTRIVGAIPWLNPSINQHAINLFVEIDEAGTRRLKRARFDIERYGRSDAWEAGAVEISDLPPSFNGVSGTPVNIGAMDVFVVQSDNVTEAPRLALHGYTQTPSGYGPAVYIRPLNAACDGFEPAPDGWNDFAIVPMIWSYGGLYPYEETIGTLYAAHRTGGMDWIVYGNGASLRVYTPTTNDYGLHIATMPDEPFRGSLSGGPSSIFVFTERDGQVRYRQVRREAASGTTSLTHGSVYRAAGVRKVAPHSGAPSADFFVTPHRSGHVYAHLCQVEGDELDGQVKYDVRPVLAAASSGAMVSGGLSAGEAQTRRIIVRNVYEKNAAAPEHILTYLHEAYRLVPQQLGLALQASGEYLNALEWLATVYDYRAAPTDRYIDYALALDAMLPAPATFRHPAGWLLDPLNPHAVARTRRGATVRYAVAAIVSCLNDYADAEFTADTGESIARARLLYDAALRLCDVPEFRQSKPDCAAAIGTLEIQPGYEAPPEVAAALGAIAEDLSQATGPGFILLPIPSINELVAKVELGTLSWAQALPELTRVRDGILLASTPASTLGTLVAEAPALRATLRASLAADPAIEKSMMLAGGVVAGSPINLLNAVVTDSGLDLGAILAAGSAPGPVPGAGAPIGVPMPPYRFCILPNPTVGVLRGHAELGLQKIRSGRNIAGIQREVPAYAAPTDATTGMPVAINGQINLSGTRAVPPTAYRYSALIARARELAQQAAQLEQLYLSALEKRDDAAYTRQKARQELALATGQMQVQRLRVTEANDGISLAELQTHRALIQQQGYQSWIAAGLNTYEQQMLDQYTLAARYKRQLARANAAAQTAMALVNAAGAGVSGAIAAAAAALVTMQSSNAAANYTSQLASAEAYAQEAALRASHERRQQEWQMLSAVAAQDIKIGEQEVVLAQDRLAIVQQEQSLAALQESQSRDTLEFLASRFTGFELYDWMSGVLGDAYRVLLQQAAAMLNVARAQLAFERQEEPAVRVQADYWMAPSSGLALPAASTGSPAGGTDDRRGLTGSARLLADLYQLDQFAFETDRRKLAISRTLSLAQLFPVEFQQFRQTGVMVFATPTALFDRDFPGHYLRLIRRVRTSVIALVPPADGVKGTLSSTGISRTVVGPAPFQTVTIRREPETVAISVPVGSSGVFEDDPSPEMYLPFEGSGVDTTWELRLPRAANRFDYRTLADVLITIDYTALNSYDYGQSVIRQLSPTVQAERAFSLRDDFPDAWYDLHNPELLAEPERFILRLPVGELDIPAGLGRVRLEHITLYLAGTDPALAACTVASLHRTAVDGAVSASTGAARAIDGTISTRRGNGAPWQPLTGGGAGGARPTPFGTWELNLRGADAAATQALQDALASGGLEDITFVLAYAAETPAWPA